MSNRMLKEVHIHEPIDEYDAEWKLLCAGVIYEHGCDLLDGNGRIHGTRGTHIIHITMPDGLTEDAANALANKVDIDEERGRRRRTRFDRLPPLFKRSDMTSTLSMPSASSTGKRRPEAG